MSEQPSDDGPFDLTGTYATSLAELASVRIDQPTLEHVLEELLRVTQRAMVASIAISVTAIQPDGSLTTAAATGAQARAVDAFEYDLDEGPCITALATGVEQLLDDVTTDRRWPRFSEYAARAGFASVAGVPLRIGQDTIGALNLYANEPGGLGIDLGAARALAKPAAIVLANGSAYRRNHVITAELEGKLDELAVINQAIGLLMARRRCDSRTAQALLLATVEATGRTLEDVAANLLNPAEDA
jgi:GAF domain-containing protein